MTYPVTSSEIWGWVVGPASQVEMRHRQHAKGSPSIYQYAGVGWEGIFTTNEGVAEMTASCGEEQFLLSYSTL